MTAAPTVPRFRPARAWLRPGLPDVPTIPIPALSITDDAQAGWPQREPDELQSELPILDRVLRGLPNL